MKEIAAHCGVSQATVSRVLNGNFKNGFTVRHEVHQRIIEVAGALGYRPNLAAKNLVQQKIDVIAILGCDVALDSGQNMVIAVVAGMITGCVGGVLRDVLCNDVPLLFRGELYASVSLVTGTIYVGAAHFGVNHGLSTVIVFVIGLTFRLLAIMFHWEMPKFIYDRDP